MDEGLETAGTGWSIGLSESFTTLCPICRVNRSRDSSIYWPICYDCIDKDKPKAMMIRSHYRIQDDDPFYDLLDGKIDEREYKKRAKRYENMLDRYR